MSAWKEGRKSNNQVRGGGDREMDRGMDRERREEEEVKEVG